MSTVVEPISGRKSRKSHCLACNRDIDVRGWKQHQDKHQRLGTNRMNGHKQVTNGIRDPESWKQGFIDGLMAAPSLKMAA